MKENKEEYKAVKKNIVKDYNHLKKLINEEASSFVDN